MNTLTLFSTFTSVGLAATKGVDYAQYVNPFIGSEGAIPGYACTPSIPYANARHLADGSQMEVVMSSLEALCHLEWSN